MRLVVTLILTPAIAHATLDPNSYYAGYQYGTNNWNQHVDEPNFCKGYDSDVSD